MPDSDNRLTSLPERPLDLDEVDDLEATDRIATVLYDENTIETSDEYAFVYNCVLVMEERLAGVIYDEGEEAWYRVYSESRPAADLTAAYDALRDERDDDSLFERAPLSVAEAVFSADRPGGEETSAYDPGDTFDCPICGDSHTVKFQDEYEYAQDIDGIDTSHLFVECSETRRTELILEFQAKTGREAPSGE